MVPRKLHDLFNKFGVVKDVFIPQKRKATNTRFGFMRYDCSIAADVAEQKANGLWVDDKSLSVKIAEYGKGIEDRQRQKPLPPRYFEPRKANTAAAKQIWQQRTDGRSFVEVTKGPDPRYQPLTTIKVDEIRNGWLYESMIMRLKPHYFA
ncbi:serine/arginine-rich splicing factor SC35-like [Camellia sinensis]|uniref:serine/arginine-rich splicing factor SC35-like n=1 Tax=Camellia sinensis TaxID=4442 RepID=UPI001036D3F3|nr:serine/arginine-rich splicing factor SC35-like [Camellia sinensis]